MMGMATFAVSCGHFLAVWFVTIQAARLVAMLVVTVRTGLPGMSATSFFHRIGGAAVA